MRRHLEVTEGEAIACTLDRDAIAARMEEFGALFRDALIAREQTVDGIRFRFAAERGVEDRIRDLARREQQCCSFFRFTIAMHGGEVWWDATVDDPTARPLLDDLLKLPDELTPVSDREQQ